MKKHTAGLALAAVTGFSILSATPAFADAPGGDHPKPPVTPYANCSEAAAENVYNIPMGHPKYGAHLDNDSDGIGCEDDSKPVTPVPADQSDWSSTPQVGTVPSGGANTGIAQEPQGSNAGVLALGGGLILAAAAGGTLIVRRHSAQQD